MERSVMTMAPEGSGLLALARREWRRTRSALSDPASLSRRAASMGVWRFGGVGAQQAIRLAGNLLMTRLLVPEAFGLVAVVASLQAGLVMMTDVGVQQSVIRSAKGEDARFLRTAWTFNLLKFLLVALGMTLLGAVVMAAQQAFDLGDTIYADSVLGPLLMAWSLTLASRGFISINVKLAERRLAVGRVVLLELFEKALSVAAMIAFALVEPSVWALFWGALIGTAAHAALSHVVLPGPRMGFLLDRAHAAEIWRFGKWLIGSSIFGFLARQGDRFILGALLAPADFGLYAVARLWIDAAGDAILKITGPLNYAAIGEVSRRERGGLAGAFAKLRIIQFLICLAPFAGVVLLGREAIDLLYAPDYHKVGFYLTLLAPLPLLYMYLPLHFLILNWGDSRMIATVTALRFAAIVTALPLAYYLFGVAGAVLAAALNNAWGAPRQIALGARLTPMSRRRELATLAAVVAGGGAVAWLAAHHA
jgi:O-antigen/teichoic acid export membrane protein